MNNVNLALNIRTYHCEEYVYKNFKILTLSQLFCRGYFEYFGKIDIVIIDNAGEIENDFFGGCCRFFN